MYSEGLNIFTAIQKPFLAKALHLHISFYYNPKNTHHKYINRYKNKEQKLLISAQMNFTGSIFSLL